MDNIASNLRLSEEKQEQLSEKSRELLSRASSERRDLVNYLSSMRSSLQTIFEGLQMRENEIVAKEKELEARQMKLNMENELGEKQLAQIDMLSKELLRNVEVNRQEAALLQSVIEKNHKELEVGQKRYDEIRFAINEKEREFDHVQKSISEGRKELALLKESIQRKTEENRVALKASEDVLESTERQLIVKQRSLEKCSRELELKEEQLKVCKTSIAESEKEIRLQEEKLKSIENLLLECSKELDLKENQLHLLQRLKNENLDSLKKSVDQCAYEFQVKEKEFESLVKQLELKEKLLESKFKVFDLKSKKIDDCLKEDELKKENFASVQRLVEEWSHELGKKEKEFEARVNEFKSRVKEYEFMVKPNAPHALEQIEQQEQTHTSFASLQSCTSKQKEDTLGVLKQQLERHNSVCGETFAVLQASSDPAKLVLDAIQGIHHLHLINEDTEFDKTLFHRGCILLSELLTEASPEISPLVKEEALKLAHEWRSKLIVTWENGLEVFGLLQFIARYKLASAFDVNELHILLDAVNMNSQASGSKKRRKAILVSPVLPEHSQVKYNLRSSSSSNT